MATFRVDDIDISPDDYIYECSENEIKELISCLKEEGHLTSDEYEPAEFERMGDGERMFEKALHNLHTKWNLLSKEDEETILRISKQF